MSQALTTSPPTRVRFGVTADAHVVGRAGPENGTFVERFVAAMREWRPDFVIDLGDLAYHCEAPCEEHLRELRRYRALYASAGCPAYVVLGNHDADWIRRRPEGEAAFLDAVGMPGRYYSFDARGFHFIVLDGNNAPKPGGGGDGARGAYWVDEAQWEWLVEDLAANRGRPKVVFSHEELHHTPPEGSGEGGQAPFPQVGADSSHVDNGWRIRRLFEKDGGVLACFAGHKHRSRWTVRGGIHYVTVAATFRGGSYARVTVCERVRIEGFGSQESYDLK